MARLNSHSFRILINADSKKNPMELKYITKIGKRFAIYLPREIVRRLNLKEGDGVEIQILNKNLQIKTVPSPFSLALDGEKFTSITLEEMERIVEEEQELHENSS